MGAVSISELKAHLSEYLRRAQNGESFHVTFRGKEVADLVPPDPVRAAVWRMVEAGEAEWTGDDMVAPQPGPANLGTPVSNIVLEDRGPQAPGDDDA